jgi:hypothetical protein
MAKVFLEKKEFEKKPETVSHTTFKRDQVVRPRRGTAPPMPVWASDVDSTSRSVHVLIYPENIRLQE